MGIIFKFVLTNIKEKKLRTFLVVVSIMASTGIFFAANGIANVFKDTVVNLLKAFCGSAEIQISASDQSPSPYVSTKGHSFIVINWTIWLGKSGTGGTYKHTKDDIVRASLMGFNYDDVETMNPIQFDSKLTIKNLLYQEIK